MGSPGLNIDATVYGWAISDWTTDSAGRLSVPSFAIWDRGLPTLYNRTYTSPSRRPRAIPRPFNVRWLYFLVTHGPSQGVVILQRFLEVPTIDRKYSPCLKWSLGEADAMDTDVNGKEAELGLPARREIRPGFFSKGWEFRTCWWFEWE